MHTFDARVYDIQAQGEFMLYQAVNMKEQVNVLHAFPPVRPVVAGQKPAYTGMAVPVGFAFRFGPDVMEIGLKAPAYNEPVFRFNGEWLPTLKRRHSVGLFTIHRVGHMQGVNNDALLIEVRVPGGTRLTVAFTHFAGVNRVVGYLEVPGVQMGATRGLCGSFDLNNQNDFIDSAGILQTQHAVAAWSWLVAKSDSMFSDSLPKPLAPVSFELFTPANISQDADELQKAFTLCRSALKFRKFLFHCTMESAAHGAAAVPMAANVEAILTADMISVDNLNTARCLEEPGSRYGPWSEFTACSRSCEVGVRTRTRGAFHFDGTRCGEIVDTAACQEGRCPVDCVVSNFGNFSACSADCGEGTRSRSRVVLVPAVHGGQMCPALMETQTCTASGGCCQVRTHVEIVVCIAVLYSAASLYDTLASWANGPIGASAHKVCKIEAVRSRQVLPVETLQSLDRAAM